MKKTRNIAIFIPHLGCPFRCCFCQQQKISATMRPPSQEEVNHCIQTALTTISPDTETEIAFFGGTFTSIPKLLQDEYLECAQPYIKTGQVQGIRISTRPDAVNIDRLLWLKQRGVTTVELGVQSLDQEVLRQSQRGYQPHQVYDAARMVRKMGIKLGIQLMIGLPGDSLQRDLYTTGESIKLAPDMVRIYPTLVIAGTELELAYYRGEYIPLTLEKAVNITAAMYLQFAKADIPVIRMGLHPSEELRQNDIIVAGPFHPAFGELVLQKVVLKQASHLIKQYLPNTDSPESLTLFCSPRQYSQLVGPAHSNLNIIQAEFGLTELRVRSDPGMPLGSIGVGQKSDNRPGQQLSRSEYLQAIPAI